MVDDDPCPPDEGTSDALLVAADEAYERWMSGGDDDPGGIAWDVMSDDYITSQFTTRDWRYLYALGAWRLRQMHDLPPEGRALVDNDLAFTLPLLGMTTLMGDRYDEDHPEILDSVRARTADVQMKTEALEAEVRLLQEPWSDAVADALDAVKEGWRVGQPDVWAVLDDPDLGGMLTEGDWAKLVAMGENEAEADPRRAESIAANFADDPERGTAGLGLLMIAQRKLDAEDVELAAPSAELRGRGLLDGWTTRLWRRKQIAPGVRINLSKSGPSISLGVRGGHVTYGPRGKTETIGLPGTGAYLQRRTPKDDK